MDSVKILSLNCHGFNLSTAFWYLSRISANVDVILLQQTWLSDAVSSKIDDALPKFLVFHSSAMEYKLSCSIRCGRPYGGTAVLIRKQLADYCYCMC